MNKKRNILLSLVVSFGLLGGGHFYLEWMIERVIQHQISINKERIKDEMKKEILQGLENDEETQRQIQSLMQKVVAKELEDNGERHVRKIIKEKYPFLDTLLTAQEQQNK